MPGLPKCRYMQERVAIVCLEGKKSVALYGVEPLYPTTQLNRTDVPLGSPCRVVIFNDPMLLFRNPSSPVGRCNT